MSMDIMLNKYFNSFFKLIVNKNGTTILNDIFSRYITSNTFVVATVNHETILEYTNNIPNCYYIIVEDINCSNEYTTKIEIYYSK